MRVRLVTWFPKVRRAKILVVSALCLATEARPENERGAPHINFRKPGVTPKVLPKQIIRGHQSSLEASLDGRFTGNPLMSKPTYGQSEVPQQSGTPTPHQHVYAFWFARVIGVHDGLTLNAS